MEWPYFVKGVLLGLLVTIPLGPVAVVCIQKTIGKGRRSGLFGGLGAVAADTCFALTAGCGVGFVIDFVRQHGLLMQGIGSLVLAGVAYHIFTTNPAVQLRRQQHHRIKGWADFAATYFLTLSNPATIFVFLAAFAGFVIRPGSSFVQLLTTVLGVTTGCALWWYLLISIVNRFRRHIRLKNLWWVNKITGAVIFVFAAVLLTRLILTWVMA